ncbi:MAG: MBL fold metallo-hydrolase, partial [Firmicutes bacterium]|nr:MBL fold metallo-hydrolase [Bacillota bacterium]
MNIQRFIANNGFGTNMYLVWDEDSKKAFIVDPGAESVQMENAISENKLQPEYIILTHAHGDHTGGIDPLKEKYPGIKLVANRAERKMLAERSRISGGEGHTADIEVTDGDTLDVGPMHLCFIDCPGHTPGGMSVLLGKVL